MRPVCLNLGKGYPRSRQSLIKFSPKQIDDRRTQRHPEQRGAYDDAGFRRLPKAAGSDSRSEQPDSTIQIAAFAVNRSD
jgi:hypothetical protein